MVHGYFSIFRGWDTVLCPLGTPCANDGTNSLQWIIYGNLVKHLEMPLKRFTTPPQQDKGPQNKEDEIG